MTDFHHDTVAGLSQLLASKQASAVELAQHYLARSQAQSTLGAYLSIDAQATLAQARQADERIATGTATPLTGVPIAHKDIFVTRGWPTTAGSKMLENYHSPFDATVVARLGFGNEGQQQDGEALYPGAGMVTLGKLNCDEFAMGSGNENSAYSKVHNPWDITRVPGGSSGGSAAAVAAGLAPAATGTDTGGSIRQPGSFCGVTGIKPTYGTVSRYGLIAYASSLDQMGPLARDAADCAAVLDLVMGRDPRDGTSLDVPAGGLLASLTGDVRGLRIGLPRECFGEGLDSAVRACVLAAADVLRDRGSLVRETAEGDFENAYTLKLMNLAEREREFEVRAEGLPGIRIQGAQRFAAPAGATAPVHVTVAVPGPAERQGIQPIRFHIVAVDDPRTRREERSTFVLP